MNVPGFTCCKCGEPVAHQITRATLDGLRCSDGRACLSRATTARHARIAAERIEDLQWLAESGLGLTESAKRIGMGANAADQLLRRRGEGALRTRLLRQDPHDWNRKADGSNVMSLGGDATYLQRKQKERAKGRPSRKRVAA